MSYTHKMTGVILWAGMICIGVGAVSASRLSQSPPSMDIVFDNFDPNDEYHPTYYTAVAYLNFPEFMEIVDVDTAMAFTPQGSRYVLEMIDLAVSLKDGVNVLDVWIMQDNDNMPGEIIETIRLDNAMPDYPGVHPPVTALSQVKPVLNAGTQYWIGLSTPGPDDSDIAWHLNANGPASRGVQRQLVNGDGEWVYYGPSQCAFRVWGTLYDSTIHVDDNGPYDPAPGNPDISDPDEDGSENHPYDSIQEAVTAAQNGDTVLIADGTYAGYGNQEISFQGKPITIRSANGPSQCIINCQFTGRGFYFIYESPDSVLEGLTIADGLVYQGRGGGIACEQASPTIRHCVITDCRSPQGGGISCLFGSAPLIDQCVIQYNKAESDFGGGLYSDSTSSPVIRHSFIRNNTAQFSGGGIYSYGGYCIIENSVFMDNAAIYSDGGGACFEGFYNFSMMTNCTLTYNAANYAGGGIYCGYDTSVTVRNCIIYDNSGAYDLQLSSQAAPWYCCIQDWIYAGTGNITLDPDLKGDGYHLNEYSPCRNAGDPTGDPPVGTDIDGEQRVMDYRIDIGADELPPRVYNQTTGESYDSIQDAINESRNDEVIIVSQGIHVPQSSNGFDFLGKRVVIRSSNPNDMEVVKSTVIDCSGLSRAFTFQNQEDSDSVLDGFTIKNGYSGNPSLGGGAIYCYQSNPTIQNCIIENCSAFRGGAIYYDSSFNALLFNCIIRDNLNVQSPEGSIFCKATNLTLQDCEIVNNAPVGVWADSESHVQIMGTVKVRSNDLAGLGNIQIPAGAKLNLSRVELSLNTTGSGTIHVEAGSEAIFAGDAVIDLGDPTDPNVRGTIDSPGLLKVKSYVDIVRAVMNISQAVFGENCYVTQSRINVDNRAPYGAFFVEDNAHFINNDIYADGDRYMNMDPSTFGGNIEGCRLFITITEGANDTRGGLFECRGEPGLATVNSCDPDNSFFCMAEPQTLPVCSLQSWTLERMELTAGAKLNLTNRFPFHYPYESGSDYDVVYVRELILREGAVLNTSYNNIYYEMLVMEPGALIENIPLLGFSIINIAFDDETEFLARVTHNNEVHFYDPNMNVITTDRVENSLPDPNGMMLLQNRPGTNPNMPVYNARAKGLFAQTNEQEVYIKFEYLFQTNDPGVELVVYLSSSPELGNYNDPNTYHEVARILPPPVGRPGSPGSGRFGIFEAYVSTGGLNFIMGTRMELLLLGPAGASVFINNWDPQVLCDGICLDLNWNTTVEVGDFLLVIGSCGKSTGLNQQGESLVCLEGPFGSDGTVDSYDICGWDWLLNDSQRLNLCGSLPLTGGVAGDIIKAPRLTQDILESGKSGNSMDRLLIIGKKGSLSASIKLEDGLYTFDQFGFFSGILSLPAQRGNIRVVEDFDGNVYTINAESGVSRLDPYEVIVSPGLVSEIIEPRYGTSATVYIGLQGTGDESFGRPILDAAFDVNYAVNGYVYVVPVVVEPFGGDPYLASAKLELTGGGAYTLVHLFDDAYAAQPGDNRDLNALREIETDASGSVYVINTYASNDSETLWRYNAVTGTMEESVVLGNPLSDNCIPAPGGLHASRYEPMLYLCSSLTSSDPNVNYVYGFTTSGPLLLSRTVNIVGMDHISDITDDPSTGTLWVTGFSMDPPDFPSPYDPPFYDSYIARIDIADVNVPAVATLTESAQNDLALPLSIVWTGTPQERCGGADVDGSGRVDFRDFSMFGQFWRQINCTQLNDCEGADLEPIHEPDGDVDIADLTILGRYWLETDCLN